MLAGMHEFRTVSYWSMHSLVDLDVYSCPFWGKFETVSDPEVLEPKASQQVSWPSIDDARPDEEGGPNARVGFSYQDEIAVSFLIGMLEDATVLKVHCETQDDIVVVSQATDKAVRIAEYVQVKAYEPDSLWSVANVCSREKGKVGSSVAEVSLSRDKHAEVSKFRIVTLRDVVRELKPLTYKPSAPDRSLEAERMKLLCSEFSKRLGEFKSAKGNDANYWLQNTIWEVCHDQDTVERKNFIRLFELSNAGGKPLLPEQIGVLHAELRMKAKEAGDLKWGPHGDQKIIQRDDLVDWWTSRTIEIHEGASYSSGGKLSKKMSDAKLSDDQIAMAVELRRDYAEEMRTPKYLDTDEIGRLQRRARSEVTTLRARYMAGELTLSPAEFYSFCIKRMDELSQELSCGDEDHSDFLKGCLYDITDRCLLRFTGAGS